MNKNAVDMFRDAGYHIHNEPVFTTDGFIELHSIFEKLPKENLNSDIDLMDVPHFNNDRLLHFLMNEEILDLVESFIGPNIGLWSSHFISKPSLFGKATPWHEDAAYWKVRFDKMGGIVTLWLVMDRSDKENGCMKVIPGTHNNGFSDYEDVDQNENIFHNQIVNVDESNTVYFELDPNECSFHEGRIIHGADANRSNRRRAGFTMRYFSQEMKYNLDNPNNKNHKLWHCGGIYIYGNKVEN